MILWILAHTRPIHASDSLPSSSPSSVNSQVSIQVGPHDDWSQKLRLKLARLQRQLRAPATLGVYVLKLRDQSEMDFNAGRLWYLSSTV
ncbi:MAG: hypothetical protein NDI61_13170, partial [Bdellovibrionaceae bacterium]|nr:hypothetical protein [Pseudobdellovibrionaceae bacterium]